MIVINASNCLVWGNLAQFVGNVGEVLELILGSLEDLKVEVMMFKTEIVTQPNPTLPLIFKLYFLFCSADDDSVSSNH